MVKRDELGHSYHWYENEIARFKKELADSDYKTIKYLEGQLSEEAFRTHTLQRATLREKIREYELKVEALK